MCDVCALCRSVLGAVPASHGRCWVPTHAAGTRSRTVRQAGSRRRLESLSSLPRPVIHHRLLQISLYNNIKF